MVIRLGGCNWYHHQLIPRVGVWGIVGALLVVALITVIYSFIIYQRLEDREGGEPLSPPFVDEPKE